MLRLLGQLRTRELKDAKTVLKDMVVHFPRAGSITAHQNKIIYLAGKVGSVQDAEWVLGELASRNFKPGIITFNGLISSCKSCDEVIKVWQMIEAAQLTPNKVTYTASVAALLDAQDTSAAESWVYSMYKTRMKPCAVHIIAIIRAHIQANNLPLAKDFLYRCMSHGVSDHETVFRSMVPALVQEGCFEESAMWLHSLHCVSSLSGTDSTAVMPGIMAGFKEFNLPLDACELINAMCSLSVVPDVETYHWLLMACAKQCLDVSPFFSSGTGPAQGWVQRAAGCWVLQL